MTSKWVASSVTVWAAIVQAATAVLAVADKMPDVGTWPALTMVFLALGMNLWGRFRASTKLTFFPKA